MVVRGQLLPTSSVANLGYHRTHRRITPPAGVTLLVVGSAEEQAADYQFTEQASSNRRHRSATPPATKLAENQQVKVIAAWCRWSEYGERT